MQMMYTNDITKCIKGYIAIVVCKSKVVSVLEASCLDLQSQ